MKKATWFAMIFILILLGCSSVDTDAGDGVSDSADAGDEVSDSDDAGDEVSDSDGDVISDDSISDISDDDADIGDTSGCDPALLGLPCEAGVGECRRLGVTVCLSPGSVGCNAIPGTPTAEICDDLDNDCDSATDEDLSGCCTVGEHAPCGTDVGECEFGDKECLPGEIWSDCSGGQGPTTETCDGEDNDCDSLTDEDWDLASDVNNCGSCGNICNLPHSIEGCSGGGCVVAGCETPDAYEQPFDVDGVDSNGCEYSCSSYYKYGHDVRNNGFDSGDEDCDGMANDPSSQNLVLYMGYFEDDDDRICHVIFDSMRVDRSGNSETVVDYALPPSMMDRSGWPSCVEGVTSHRRCSTSCGMPLLPDYGYLFDGVDDYLYFNDSTDLDSISSAFTFFIWVNPETLEDGDYVIWRQPGDQFSLKMRNVGGHFKWQFCLSSTTCGNTISDVAVDTWTLLIFTYSAPTLQIYVNAVAEASFTGSFTPGGEMRMGGDGSAHNYHGGTDEIALYNVALPVSDISWYYEFARPRP